MQFMSSDGAYKNTEDNNIAKSGLCDLEKERTSNDYIAGNGSF